jgi:dTDP-4-dehydrorhamnose reductase
MMKILLLGKNGQLGWELNRALLPLGQVQAVDYPEINLAEADGLRAFVRAYAPDAIVNATAYTAVDRAESERDLAFAINAAGPGILAEEAKKLGAILIHYSTDYVFAGTKGAPYLETDLTHPLSAYGESKLAGEQAVQAVNGKSLIFRTAWVYSLRRDSFVSKVWQWARRNETLKLVDDQISNPTWARMLAEATAQIMARGLDFMRERSGLYHLAGSGFASRLQWAESILTFDPHPQEQIVKTLLPAKTSEFPSPAERPLFSALDCSRFAAAFGFQLPDWKQALALACEN